MQFRTIVMLGLGIALSVATQGSELSGAALLHDKKPAKEAAIYLESKNAEKRAAPLEKAVVDQRQKTFLPHVSVVTVGTTVEFPNHDNVFHNVFAYFNAKKFDLGMYPKNATRSVSFDKPGLVALLCNVHSEMSAYIMVVQTPYYAVTDKKGQFRIKDVPPGTYLLRVWHETGSTLSKTIEIKADPQIETLILERKERKR